MACVIPNPRAVCVSRVVVAALLVLLATVLLVAVTRDESLPWLDCASPMRRYERNVEHPGCSQNCSLGCFPVSDRPPCAARRGHRCVVVDTCCVV